MANLAAMAAVAAVAACQFAQKAANAANTNGRFVPQMLQLLEKLQLQVVNYALC